MPLPQGREQERDEPGGGVAARAGIAPEVGGGQGQPVVHAEGQEVGDGERAGRRDRRLAGRGCPSLGGPDLRRFRRLGGLLPLPVRCGRQGSDRSVSGRIAAVIDVVVVVVVIAPIITDIISVNSSPTAQHDG